MHTRQLTFTAIAIASVLAIVASACGGEDATDSTPGPSTVASEVTPSSSVDASDSDTATPSTESVPSSSVASADDLRPVVGVSESEIRLGINLLKVEGPLADVLPDVRAQWEALIAETNESGGVGGRQLVPSYFEYDPMGDVDPQAQAACAQFVQDDQVFAVIGSYPAGPVLQQCLDDAGVVFVDTSYAGGSDADYAERPLWFTPNALSLEATADAIAATVVAQQFVDEQTTVGLVYSDDAMWSGVVDSVLLPALDASGVSVAATVPVTGVLQNAEAIASTMASAVLEFKSAGVDRVMFFYPGGRPLGAFVTAAEDQDYRPRYGISTLDFAAQVAANPAVPRAQFVGALGVGWNPYGGDVSEQSLPEFNAAAERCFEILERRAGQSGFDANSRNISLASCEAMFFFADVASSVENLEPAAFAQAVADLGDSYVSPIAFATEFGAERHFGVDAVRPFTYTEACDCFEYLDTEPSLIQE